ncbi:hypothetical protein [Polyangium sp. 6x1]|uniref:hypothetical protein n=1 Tax=Polyangium sp. 6x1 TaxID=3042689 RepID=UPI0024832079|nr:hypothetical protein [Polyangium sp. 6x1]MDI1451159.1 hypothetical protein [Polyangium sp. 6x1]
MNTMMTASMFRHLGRVTSGLLLGALSLGCVTAVAEDDLAEESIAEASAELSGWHFWSWGTTTDEDGLDISSTTPQTCVLSGVAGNLNVGAEWSNDEESLAWVGAKYPLTGTFLYAHGGAYTNQNNVRVWANNPVNASATCFHVDSATSNGGSWKSSDGSVSPPVKIADLDPNNLRQCFLSGLWGIAGAWNSSSRFARVVKKTSTDATHPTTGWYVEANLLSNPYDGSHARVFATCVNFPLATVITSGPPVSAAASVTNTVPITSGTGIKGCALTGITGALNQNDWTDGALIAAPSTVGGDWTLSVKNNKTAEWACAN